MDKDKKKKAALLDPVIDLVAKSDHIPYGVVEGVSADALDVIQTGSRANLLKKALQNQKLRGLFKKTVASGPAPTIPLRLPVGVTPKPNQIPKGRTLKNASKAFKAALKRNPIVSPAVLAYETAAIITSEKARMDATNQAEDMAKRSAAGEDTPWHGYGGSTSEIAKNMAKNGFQGYLDPAGTIYAAGDGLTDYLKTTAQNLADSLGLDDKVAASTSKKETRNKAMGELSETEREALKDALRKARSLSLRKEYGNISDPEEARELYNRLVADPIDK